MADGSVSTGDLGERERALFETMPIGVVYQAADGSITGANPAAERILGLSLDQMQGRTSVDPRWRAVRADGSDFPGEEHPAMVALRSGERVHGVVMGVFNPAADTQTWIRVDATPLFEPGAATPSGVYTTFLDITAETLGERSLGESETRFRRLFDAMNEGVAYCLMLYEAQGRADDFVYQSVNPAFARLTGLEDVEGRRVTEVIPTIKAETPELFETYGRVARSGVPAEFDIEFTPLGMHLHIKVFCPEPDHFVAVFEDVTERRRALAALEDSERRLRSVMETTHVGCQILDGEWRYVYLNPAAEAHNRRPGAELLGRRFADMWPGIEATEVYRRVEACMARRTTERLLNQFSFPDGEVGWFDLVVQPLADGVLIQSLDVTEHVRAEAALRESEARLRLAQEAAKAGTWEWDLETGENTWSPELWRLYDYEPAGREASYDTWLESILPEDRAQAAAIVGDAATRGVELNVEWRVATADGSLRWLMSRGQPERDESGRVTRYRGIVVDITERKTAEAEIGRLNERLERRVTERTAELRQATDELQGFVHSISHDLRTPLRTIGSYSQILLQDHAAELDDDAQDALWRIERANARMVRLVDGLLELSGLTHTPLRALPVDVTRLAREVAEEIRDGEPGRAVELTVAEDLRARADEALLRVVFYDLLGNAWKFTAGRDVAHIEVGADQVDGKTAFFVRDDGAGFDQRYVDKLFAPFERLHDDAEFKRTGIGLATVRRIVERHGGRVWAEGEVGGGATFWFTLP